jgi:hypothetical protein
LNLKKYVRTKIRRFKNWKNRAYSPSRPLKNLQTHFTISKQAPEVLLEKKEPSKTGKKNSEPSHPMGRVHRWEVQFQFRNT